MKIICFAFIVIINTNAVFTQSINITVNNLETSVASFSYLEGEKTFLVDSIKSIKSNNIKIVADNYKLHIGFYRITFTKNNWIDFINDGEDVEIKTDANNIIDSLLVINSESNRLYYSFIKLNKDFKTKTELLRLILARYPQDDDYYNTTLDKLNFIQSNYLVFVNHTSQSDPSSFIARYIQSAQLPVTDGTISIEDQLDYLKKHSLDDVDFNDSELIYSDLFTSKSIEYLTYYRNPQLPKGILEKEFMKAVDKLLNKAKVNELVYQHITEYLIDGFKKFGFDKIIDYIVENYVIADDLCLNEKTESSIKKRIDQSKYLTIGSTVPNIIIPDSKGSYIDLSELTANKILILFYSIECPHCKTVIPRIKELYDNMDRNDFEVLAISLDTKKEEWQNFITQNNLNWLNGNELRGWNSKVAEDFYIYATPTMFLVDRNRKIISKPITSDEIVYLFGKN